MSEKKCPFKDLLEPRGDDGYPFINSFPSVAWDIVGFLVKTREKYGDIAKFKIFGFTNYLVSHPDDIAQVLKKEKSGHYMKKRLYEAFYPAFGNGLFNSYGQDWEQQRKQLQPFFNKSKVSEWFPLVVDESLKQFQEISDRSAINAENVIQPLMQSIMSHILFGLKPEDKNSQQLIQAIELVSEKLADHGIKSFVFNGLLNKLPTPGNLKYKAALKTIDNTIRDISENESRDTENSLLPLFAQFMNPKELRDQLFTLYFAGQETIISTLLWVLYYLAQHPEHQARGRAEVVEGWPTKKAVHFAALDRFVFLNAAIDEAMRLAPAAFLTYKDVAQDTQLGAYKLKEDGLVTLSMYVTHRHPDLWEDPLEYKPERFLHRTNKGYAFYPYGGGMHMCIGMHLARMEITTIMALFLRSFEFKLKPGAKVIPVTHLTLKPKHGIPLLINSLDFIKTDENTTR